MTATESKPRNLSVDVFRLLAALCIIVLHLQYPDVPRNIAVAMRLMSRWAIPFFFIVSGYFLALKYSKTGKLNVLPTVERLIWVFLLWIVIYVPFFLSSHDLATLLKLIIAPAFIFFGLMTHLWFLPSLLFGYLFISFSHHYKVKILLPVMSVVALGMALLSGAYNVFDLGIPLDYNNARSWLSIPFLYVGFLLQKKRPNWQLSALLILFGAGLQFFEAKYLYDRFQISAYDHQFLIGTIFMALGMAGLALNDLKFFQLPLISKWGSDHSLGIYLIHPMILLIFMPQIARLAFGLTQTAAWQVAAPLVVLVIALALLSLIQRFLPYVFAVLFGTQIESQPKQ